AASRCDERADLAQKQSGSWFWFADGKCARRLLFPGRDYGERRSLDDQRNGGESRWTTRCVAGPLEVVRWKRNFRLPVPATREIHGETSSADRDSWRAGGPITPVVPRFRQLLLERTGHRHTFAECAR